MFTYKTSSSRKIGARQVIGILCTVLINILLYLMVDGIFAYDLTLGGGKVLS